MVAPNHPLLKAALELPLADRLDLAERLLLSMDVEHTAQVEAAWQAEAEDRLAAYKRGELVADAADHLLAELKQGRCP